MTATPHATPNYDFAQGECFLQLLGKDPAQTRIRGFFEKHDPRKQGDAGRKASYSRQTVQQWVADGRGIYVVINDGGDSAQSITACRALFNEWDDQPRQWQLTAWRALALSEPSFQVDTGRRSVHSYWLLDETIPAAQWADLQQRLEALGKSDTLKDPSRVMRLPGCPRGDGDREPVRLLWTPPEHGHPLAYGAADWDTFLPPTPPPAAPSAVQPIILEKPSPSAGDLPLRPLEQVRAALQHIPPRIPGSGTYPDDRAAAIGYIQALMEAGGTFELAMADLRAHHKAWTDIGQVIRSSDLTAFTAGSFWHAVKVNGGTADRTDLKSNHPDRSSHHPHGFLPGDDGTIAVAQKKAANPKPTEEVLKILRGKARALIGQRMPPHERSVTLRTIAQTHGAHITPAEITQLLTVARQDLRGKPQSVALGQKLHVQRRKWLCEGLLPAGRPTLMVSVPKVGKTTLLCALVSAWHYGRGEFLGMPLHGSCPPVLLLGPDMTPEDWVDLLVPLGLARFTADDEIELLPPIHHLWHSESGIALNEEGFEEIEEKLHRHDDALLIADSYTSLTAPLGLDEWKAEIAGPLLDLSGLCSRYDATPVVIHHAGKSRAGERASSASRGGNALPAAVSQVVSLRWLDDAAPGAVRRDSRVVLSTEGRGGRPLELVIEQQDGRQWLLHGDGAQFEAEKIRQRQIEKISKNERQGAVYALVTARWNEGFCTGANDVLDEIGDLFQGADQAKMARRTLEQLDHTHGLIEQKKTVQGGRGVVALYQPRGGGNSEAQDAPSRGGTQEVSLLSSPTNPYRPASLEIGPFSPQDPSGGLGQDGKDAYSIPPREGVPDCPHLLGGKDIPSAQDDTHSACPGFAPGDLVGVLTANDTLTGYRVADAQVTSMGMRIRVEALNGTDFRIVGPERLRPIRTPGPPSRPHACTNLAE